MSDKPILNVPMSEEEFDAQLYALCEKLLKLPEVAAMSDADQEDFIYRTIREPDFLRKHFGATIEEW
jgi:hypothetical protein